jgi:hypothetical protein
MNSACQPAQALFSIGGFSTINHGSAGVLAEPMRLLLEILISILGSLGVFLKLWDSSHRERGVSRAAN